MSKPKAYLRLVHGNQGRIHLKLISSASHAVQGSIMVETGQAYAQKFRTAVDPDSRPGSMEPIPEGHYGIGPHEQGDFGPGLGSHWWSIIPKQTMARGEFGFHLDANRSTAPGSAGCIVFPHLISLNTFIHWLDKWDVADLYVDWGLGYVLLPKPAKPAQEKRRVVKVFVNDNGATLLVDGEEFELGLLEIVAKEAS